MKCAAIVALMVLAGWWLAAGPPIGGSSSAPLMGWMGTDHLPLAVGLLATLIALAVGGGNPEPR